MPLLLLSRATPLSQDELQRLPLPLVPVSLGDGVIARATVDLAIPELLSLVFELGKTFPDAGFKAEEVALAPVPPPAEPAPAPPDPWKLAAQGDYTAALPLLQGSSLDSAGRDRLRAMLNGSDNKAIVFACQAAIATSWRSIAISLRSLLSSPAPEVRIAAMEAMSNLAGPSLAPAVRPLLADPDPAVRTAAEAAMKKLGW